MTVVADEAQDSSRRFARPGVDADPLPRSTPDRRPGSRFPRLPGRVTAQSMVVVVLIAFLTWQVVVPVAALVYTALRGVRPDADDYFVPNLSFGSFERAFADGMTSVVINSVIFCAGSALLTVLLGGYLSFVTTRTNAWCRTLVAALMIYQLAIPSAIYPVAWLFIFGERTGVLTTWWTDLTGAGAPLVAESMTGMIIVQSFEMLPMVYLFLLPAASTMNRTLEEAAEIAGASRLRMLYDIGLKLATPALIATFFVALLRAWDSFAIPWYLGAKVGIFTFSSELFRRTTTPPSDTSLISAFAVPMVIVAVLMVIYYQRFNRKAGNYAVMSGKGFRSQRLNFRLPTRIGLGIVAGVIVVASGVLPILMMTWMSLFPFFRMPSLDAWANMSLDSFAKALETPGVLEGFANSALVGCVTALLVITVCIFSGWIVVHGRGRSRHVLDFLTSVPIALPNIVVGICALWLYFATPFNIRGTHLILILTYFTLFVALAARVINARLLQLDRELFEAAQLSGAGFVVAMRTVVAPLVAPAVAAIGLYIVAAAFKELETAVLLSAPATKTTSVVIFNATGQGTLSQTAAIGLLATSGVLVLVVAWQILARRFKVAGF
jgi:iron(III) transport system permease protein